MENTSGYLKRKAAELGLDRADKLAEIQEYLDELYPGQCRAVSLNDGILVIRTSASTISSEIRYQTNDLINKFKVKNIRVTASY